MNPKAAGVSRFVMPGAIALVGAALCVGAAQNPTAAYNGLEITATKVERATRVNLQDCPPGENSVRGVIRPTEDNEFATVQIDVEVLPAFAGGEIPKPLLFDDAGTEYKTAQSFREIDPGAAFSCSFSFRVPKGTKISRFVVDSASIDLSSLEN